jgi:hypothetical protein
MSNEHDRDVDFDDGDDPTVVIVPRDFVIGSLGRAADALLSAGGICLDARALVTAGKEKTAIPDLIDEMKDLRDILAGLVRALERLEFEDDNRKR